MNLIKSAIPLMFGAIAWRGVGRDIKRLLFTPAAT